MASTTSRPIIQLQGYSPEPLESIYFDLSNAAGQWLNEQGFVTHQHFDTNLFKLTTNWFECTDLELTNGANAVTLRVTDLAGNVSTSNLSYTLDFSGDTTPPALTLHWPQNGAQISGSEFTLRAWVDDPTAAITVSGLTPEPVEALVERNGLVWVENLPLASGNNNLTLTMTDAAGNVSTANLTVVKSAVNLTVDDYSGNDLYQPVFITGTINVSDHKVWVISDPLPVSAVAWLSRISPSMTRILHTEQRPTGSTTYLTWIRVLPEFLVRT